MAIVVVGGSARNVGKTALICGFIAALPEFAWTAVKITSHDHAMPEPVWEEMQPGTETDTGRYLAAGARHAYFITARPEDLGKIVGEMLERHTRSSPRDHLIFESNQILQHIKPDLCLGIEGNLQDELKPSFRQVAHQMDAVVRLGGRNECAGGEIPLFRLAALEHISPEMLEWLRARLSSR